MKTIVLNKSIRKEMNWIDPKSESTVTLEEYRTETNEAENSGFVNFENHKKNMNEWIAAKLL